MVMMADYIHGQFCWVDLMAHDMAKARVFYERLFGWASVEMDTQGGPPYAQFELDGKAVAGIGQISDELRAHGVPPMWHSYVYVNDVEAVVAKATELGAQIAIPVMKVLDAGWLAFIKDPVGAQVGLWQKNQHRGAARVNDPGCFCWNELVTRDLDKAREFYGNLFPWDIEEYRESPAKYYIAKNQGRENAGLMQMTDEFGDMPPCWTVYFTVDDIDASVEKLAQLGGKVEVPPFDLPVGRMAVVADAQGAYFNVVKMNTPPE